jgi:hypothetical protein
VAPKKKSAHVSAQCSIELKFGLGCIRSSDPGPDIFTNLSCDLTDLFLSHPVSLGLPRHSRFGSF